MALDFYAGCLGGCAGVIVGHPFDTVKVRLQTQDAKRAIYRGTFHCISTIIKKESVRGLFKGMSSPMAGLSAVNAVVFGTYGNLLRSSPSQNSLVSHFIAGSAAGFIQSVITSPMELAKTRMQLQCPSLQKNLPVPYWRKTGVLYQNPLDCLKKVFRSEGVRGLFRGLGCTVLRDSPGFGVYFCGYEYLTQRVNDAYGQVNTLPLLISGGLAGVMSWIVIYPVDVLKSRIQADGMAGPRKYDGLLDCARKSYRNEGLKVFTRGLNSTVIRAFPTNAATFAVVTWVIMFFDPSVRRDSDVKLTTKDIMMDKKFQTIAACADSCG